MKNSTWVLLRGLGREKGHWGAFLDQFAQAFPNDEILPLDLPGVGEFKNERSPLTISEIFQRVRARAIERARSQNTFKICALSLGGMVAMEWLRSKPDDLAACVLINSSVRQCSPFYARLRWQVWPALAKIVGNQSVKERERQLVELLINSLEARERALPLWIKIGNENSVSYLNLLNQLVAASRFNGLESAPAVPVLLLGSLGDRFVDPSCTLQMHEKWQWPVQQHAWAGHDLPWDDPAWTIEKIRQWNRTVDTSR